MTRLFLLVGAEVRLLARHPVLWAISACFSALGWGLAATRFGATEGALWSPYVVALSLGVLMIPGIIGIALLAAVSALRDVESGMRALVDASPTGGWGLRATRFVALALVACGVFALAGVAHGVGVALAHGQLGGSGTVAPAPYVHAIVGLVVPDLLLIAALIYAVGLRTRSSVACWVAGVLLLAVYFVTALLIDSPLLAGSAPATPEALARAALLDPLGLSAVFDQTRYWSAADRETRALTLTGRLLINRVVWVSAAGVLLLVGLTAPGGEGRHARRRFAIPLTVTQRWLVALLAAWAVVVLLTLHSEAGQAEYYTRLLPSAGLLSNALRFPVSLFGSVVVALVAGDVVWRDRLWRLSDVVDATPAHHAQLWWRAARAVCASVAALLVSTVVLGVGYQVVRQYRPLDLLHWLLFVVTAAVPLLVLAAAALFLQALSSNRWVGAILTLGLAFLQVGGDGITLLSHPLTRYGAMPPLSWSVLSGYSSNLVSWLAFGACWSAAALTLTFMAIATWPRGRQALGRRIRSAATVLGTGGRWGMRASGGLSVAIVAVLGARTVPSWESRDAAKAWRVSYERRWRSTEHSPVPHVVKVEAELDLASRGYRLRGTMRLVNATPEVIDTVHVNLRRDQQLESLTIRGRAASLVDTTFRVHTFPLSAALAPGDSVDLAFALRHDEPRVSANPSSGLVAPGATVLTSAQLLPSLGYRSGYEVQDERERRLARLGSAIRPARLDTTAGKVFPRPEWYTLDLSVSAPEGYEIATGGRVTRSWRRDGRRYQTSHFDGRVAGRFGVASAAYVTQSGIVEGIPVEVLSSPAHVANARRILEAALWSVARFQRLWGRYPFSGLQIAEVPTGFLAAALALPGIILFAEDRGFLTDARDSTQFDLITRRVAHEVAHMWWGNSVAPAEVEGATIIVETLAKGAEQLAILERGGSAMLDVLLEVDRERYRVGVATAPETERSLWRATNEDYLYYGKGALVMDELRRRLGTASLHRALAALVAAHAGPTAPPATLHDVLRALLRETPPGEHARVRQLFLEPGLPPGH